MCQEGDWGMSKEVMKLALEALETLHDENMDYLTRNKLGGENNQCMVFAREAITALREALAEQPEQQEPFGYFRYDLRLDAWVQNRAGLTGTPFYTSPPAQRTWVGLTDEERIMCRSYDPEESVAKTEAKLKEKNT